MSIKLNKKVGGDAPIKVLEELKVSELLDSLKALSKMGNLVQVTNRDE